MVAFLFGESIIKYYICTMKFNHNRPLDDFSEVLDKIRSAGFNPIGVTQMYLEDTFIFENKDEAMRAYHTLEQNENGVRNYGENAVMGWYYSKDDFIDAIIEYESEMDSKVLVYWLNK